MAITSQPHAVLDFASFSIVSWQSAGLLKPLFAKPVLTTIEQTLVIRSMGKLSGSDQKTLHKMLTKIIG